MSDILWPHALQHARLPCPSLSPDACSNSCPLNQWCHPTSSSSVSLFSSFPQVFSFSSVQSFSRVQVFATPWTAARQASLSIINSWSLLKFMSTAPMMPSSHLILCCPLLLLPSIFPRIRVFSNESVLHIRWPKYWSFNFSISPSNEYSGLISFRIGWLDHSHWPSIYVSRQYMMCPGYTLILKIKSNRITGNVFSAVALQYSLEWKARVHELWNR